MYSGYKFLLDIYTTDFISKFASHQCTLPKSYFNEHLFQCCLKHPFLPFCARNILSCKISHIPHSYKYTVIPEKHFRSFNTLFFVYQGKIILQLTLVYSVRQGLRFIFFHTTAHVFQENSVKSHAFQTIVPSSSKLKGMSCFWISFYIISVYSSNICINNILSWSLSCYLIPKIMFVCFLIKVIALFSFSSSLVVCISYKCMILEERTLLIFNFM